MSAGVIVCPPAGVDVREAAFWHEAKREGLGVEFILEVDALYHRISENPLSFAEIEPGVRRALVHRLPYAAYFIPPADHQPSVILAVLHQRRSSDAWRERL